MKFLKIDDMLEVLREQCGEDSDIYRECKELAESAANMIAARIVNINPGVARNSAEDQGAEFGGLCVGFFGAAPDQLCPQAIHDRDEGGEWSAERPQGWARGHTPMPDSHFTQRPEGV